MGEGAREGASRGVSPRGAEGRAPGRGRVAVLKGVGQLGEAQTVRRSRAGDMQRRLAALKGAVKLGGADQLHHGAVCGEALGRQHRVAHARKEHMLHAPPPLV